MMRISFKRQSLPDSTSTTVSADLNPNSNMQDISRHERELRIFLDTFFPSAKPKQAQDLPSAIRDQALKGKSETPNYDGIVSFVQTSP